MIRQVEIVMYVLRHGYRGTREVNEYSDTYCQADKPPFLAFLY